MGPNLGITFQVNKQTTLWSQCTGPLLRHTPSLAVHCGKPAADLWFCCALWVADTSPTTTLSPSSSTHFLLSYRTKSDSHSAVWWTSSINGDIEPSSVVLGEQASMEKTTKHFQKIATTFADLNAEGLNAEAVNELLTMYVGAAS